jgi:N-acetylmuramoyl-L-alanine amidase
MKNSFLYYIGVLFLISFGNILFLYSAEKPFVVVLDAGHGGKDAGAIGYSLKLKEKTVNLKTVLKLGKLLEKEENIKVIYTRKKDVFIPLDERAQIANRAKADLFISIHTNSAQSRSAKGTETYTVGSSSANL